jgi:hypothetical protein
LAFFNLKNRARRKTVIHEYKIEEKSMDQTDPLQSIAPFDSMAALLRLPVIITLW